MTTRAKFIRLQTYESATARPSVKVWPGAVTDASDGVEPSTTSRSLGTVVQMVNPNSSTTSAAGTTTNTGVRTRSRSQEIQRHADDLLDVPTVQRIVSDTRTVDRLLVREVPSNVRSESDVTHERIT